MNHPTPTAIKILEGNPSGRPLNDREPIAAAGAPIAPSDLDREEQIYWHKFCGLFASMGTLNTCDGDALKALCQASVIRDQARQILREQGLILMGSQGAKKNPADTIFNEQIHTIRTLLGEFGLTPASRTRIKAESPDLDDDFLRVTKQLTGQ